MIVLLKGELAKVRLTSAPFPNQKYPVKYSSPVPQYDAVQ